MSHQALRSTAALLRQGQVLHHTALVLLLAALLSPGWASVGAALIAGLETYVAVRVGLDARLFEALADDAAEGRLDWPAFDAGLVEAGLLGSAPANRPVAARIAGAAWWFRVQAALVAALAGVAILAIGSGR